MEWPCACAISVHRVYVQLTCIIHQQLCTSHSRSNSVQNCESDTCSALINSCIDYKDNTLIAHIRNILMALIIVSYVCTHINRVKTNEV